MALDPERAQPEKTGVAKATGPCFPRNGSPAALNSLTAELPKARVRQRQTIRLSSMRRRP